MKKVLSIFIISILVSCQQYPYSKEVVKALLESGDNKEQLVKVLEHYRDKDSLKYEAACFLIGNMPYHRSSVQYCVDSLHWNYFTSIDSILASDPDAPDNDLLKQSLGVYFDSLPPPQLTNGKPDVEILSADYLIRSIEQAFEMWYISPLLKCVSFEEFKEWILPYRTFNEALTDTKEQLYRLIYNYLSEQGMENIRYPLDCYEKQVRLRKKMNAHITKKVHLGAFDLYLPAFRMDCHNLGIRTCNYFRACGIPVVLEFTPQWVAQESGHYWCASPDSNHVLQPYTPPYNNLRKDWDLSLKYAGKVYQVNYGISFESPFLIRKENEPVPGSLNFPFIKDVTDRYHECVDLTLPLPSTCGNNLAYLCFFRNGEKNPVAWGKTDHAVGTVTFNKVPLNMLFIPAYLEKKGVITFGDSFLLQKDSVTGKIVKKEFACEPEKRIDMRLLRKYPPKPHLVDYAKHVKGACLIASDREEGPYDTLFILKHVPVPYWQEYDLHNSLKYRYYWFKTNPKAPVNIAEFEFLGKRISSHVCSVPTPLPVFFVMEGEFGWKENDRAKIEGTPLQAGPLYYKVYDGDPETFIESPYLGMDFETPVCISHIRFLPRNAMNTIEPGCRYRLLYYQDNEWRVHATKKAIYNFVDFSDVPAGTVYWLRNLDKGKEELPFFYIDGKQVFINEFLD